MGDSGAVTDSSMGAFEVGTRATWQPMPFISRQGVLLH